MRTRINTSKTVKSYKLGITPWAECLTCIEVLDSISRTHQKVYSDLARVGGTYLWSHHSGCRGFEFNAVLCSTQHQNRGFWFVPVVLRLNIAFNMLDKHSTIEPHFQFHVRNYKKILLSGSVFSR